ncbi:hypothetical protein BU26DRAFT_567180 [Trematosphaeria pertusa]|uniref:Rhodopsin domain-containing protein n=1 Tax=Trematosphaeria pertusa TaxID=390896 RepID=A0A6A6IBB9_9PLEO|nr:uncharacterized protein BU26DRAFT_567180 [Trematosphaeria pertusa]KAF2246840.1 hypothetical protein BU26DRAFT_567180 [Trematosphaeria pertusa]
MFKATNHHQLAVVIVPVIMVVLATLCVALRFRARRLQKAQFAFDDWLCFVALLLTWVFQGINMAAVFAGGVGLPIATVMAIDPNAITTFLKILFVNFSLWIVVVSVVQLSIMFFYIRIFGIVDTFRWACYVLVALITGLGIAGFFGQIFFCVPVSKQWNPTEQGHCIALKPWCSSISLMHVILDFGIVILPMPLIWKLKVSTRSKVILSVLLCLGLIASIISLIKIGCVIDLTGIPPQDVTDYSWFGILLQTLELPIGIICCCVPSLKPVMVELAPKLNSMANRLLSYARSSRSTINKSYGSRSGGNSGNESVTGFARLDDSSSQVGERGLGNKTVAHAEEVELANREPDSGNGNDGIAVITSYTVSRN